MITIIDYGSGNIMSVGNMLKKVGHRDYQICTHPSQAKDSSKYILPGVGHFDFGMQQLMDRGWDEFLQNEVVVRKRPILGICLGLQLMTLGSTEGDINGLGFFNAKTYAFADLEMDDLSIPNMGWLDVQVSKTDPLFENATDEQRFYFVHSYYVRSLEENQRMVTANYGIEFDAGLIDGHIMGVQFHPEKSHRYGMNLLKNFAAL